MTTFTATQSVAVTIPASSFADTAERHASEARRLAAEAAGYLTTARRILPDVPQDFRTPGGAPAEYVVDMIATDANSVAEAASRATAAALKARLADTAQHAAWAETDALHAMKTARFDTGSVVRLLGYLPR